MILHAWGNAVATGGYIVRLNSLAGVMLAAYACSGGGATAASLSVIYAFKGGADGAVPLARLIDVGGALYGTTASGGASNDGTVFTVTPAGAETVVHSFAGHDDGEYADTPLTSDAGALFGTTRGGGVNGFGTLFKIGKAGAESVVYSFDSSGERYPVGALAEIRGALFGTTGLGGTHHKGSIFRVSKAGAESVIYSFSGKSDGAVPLAGLVGIGGALYGTASGGGGANHGVVFTLTSAGAERILYSFKGGADGAAPDSALIDVRGTLYGTTQEGGGGTGCSGKAGCGTVFRLSAAGVETVLYAFKGGADGASPAAGLTYVNGTLYGTTLRGGGTGCSGQGCGVVFALTQGGVQSVVHAFTGGADGGMPYAPMIKAGKALYGTTEVGGASNDGVVFKVTP